MRYLIITSCIFCMVGCAGLSYTEPQTGARARVRFVTDTTSPSVLRVYDGEDCSGNEHEWMRLRVGVLLTGSLKRLGMPLWNYHENAAKEVYVSVEKPFSGIFWGTEIAGNYHAQCGVPITASFQKDKDYEIKYVWDAKKCSVSVSEINPISSGEYTFTQISSFTNKVTSKNNGCYKQFTRFRL